jgi:hypothetical protein
MLISKPWRRTRAALRRLLAMHPGYSIAWQRAFFSVPMQHNSQAIERLVEGARLVGVPEEPAA